MEVMMMLSGKLHIQMHYIHISDSEPECYISLVQANLFMASSWQR